MSAVSTTLIRVGHSPDPDDAFMFYALATNKVTSPKYSFQHTLKDAPSVVAMMKNYRLSDDIAFRFSNRGWKEWPLSAEKFAGWVNQINGDGFCCNLFMDYETFGEHQWADTGIFEFLDALPGAVYDTNHGHNDFLTPSQLLDCYEPVGEYDVKDWISWADSERDLSAWLGNPIQDGAAAAAAVWACMAFSCAC